MVYEKKSALTSTEKTNLLGKKSLPAPTPDNEMVPL